MLGVSASRRLAALTQPRTTRRQAPRAHACASIAARPGQPILADQVALLPTAPSPIKVTAAASSARGATRRASRTRPCASTAATPAPAATDALTPPPPSASRTRFTESFTVRCYEAGASGSARLESVLDLLQETAANHAVSVFGEGQSEKELAEPHDDGGFATDDIMRSRSLLFAMSRLHMRLGQPPPRWRERIAVDTWFNFRKAGATRDWDLRSSGGVVGTATSTWVCVNSATRRLSRMPLEMQQRYGDRCATSAAVPGARSSDAEKLPASAAILGANADSATTVGGIRVRRGDVDMNQHVNNVAYARWLLEAVPDSTWDAHDLAALTIEWRCESHAGDAVDSHSMPSATVLGQKGSPISGALPGETVLYHWVTLSGSQDKGDVVRAKTFWKPRVS